MKNLLIALLVIMASCTQEKNDFTTEAIEQKQALQKPGKGHHNNTTLPTLSLIGSATSSSVTWNWTMPVLSIGEIYKVIIVTRKFVDEAGNVYIDPNKDINDTLNHWQVINQGNIFMYSPTAYNTWIEFDTRPLDWSSLRKGTYTCYVNVTKGQYWNTLDHQDAISNRFTVVVP